MKCIVTMHFPRCNVQMVEYIQTTCQIHRDNFIAKIVLYMDINNTNVCKLRTYCEYIKMCSTGLP